MKEVCSVPAFVSALLKYRAREKRLWNRMRTEMLKKALSVPTMCKNSDGGFGGETEEQK